MSSTPALSAEQAIDSGILDKVRALKRRASDRLAQLLSNEPLASPKRVKVNEDARSQYVILLKSFTPLLWRSTDLTPRELATHGWRCIGEDRAECDACHKIICTTLPSIVDVDVDVYKKCLNRVRSQIIEAHETTCLHRSSQIDFHDQKSQSHLLDGISSRLLTFSTHVEICPIPDGVEIPAELFPSHPVPTVMCAALNWKQKSCTIGRTAQVTLSCDLCSRTSSVSETPFNPVSSHYNWCPVLDAGLNDLPYWMQELQSLVAQKRTDAAATCLLAASSKLRRSLSSITGTTQLDLNVV